MLIPPGPDSCGTREAVINREKTARRKKIEGALLLTFFALLGDDASRQQAEQDGDSEKNHELARPRCVPAPGRAS